MLAIIVATALCHSTFHVSGPNVPQGDYANQHDRILEAVTRRYSALAKEIQAHNIYGFMNHMTDDVRWTERHGKDVTTFDRVAMVQKLQNWIMSCDPKGFLRFHINRMKIVGDDEVETEVDVQYEPEGVAFHPKRKDEDKTIWREDLVQISERWLLRRGEQIYPKDTPWPAPLQGS